MMRILSNFPVKDGKGVTKDVPVMYGDLTRQVANIIRENSENKLPSAPRISVYITGLELEKARILDPTFVKKSNIRERAFNEETGEYENYQGKNYTVERLMPTPYLMRLNADIWASNTDQKLQILEQILVLFNPSLEMQKSDNFIDWTAITVVNLENVNWSNRSVPIGVDSEIDIATLTFSIPIYISPPVKVKKMGVVTNIITSMFDETRGTIEEGVSPPQLNQFNDAPVPGTTGNSFGNKATTILANEMANVNYNTYGVYLENTVAQLYANGKVGSQNWEEITEALPGQYGAGVSRIFLTNNDTGITVTGTFALNPLDSTAIQIDFDEDTFPQDTIIDGRTNIDYIIDPTTFNPLSLLAAGLRLLILEDIGKAGETVHAQAWTNNDNTGLVAKANDIIEWDGSKWNIIFDASAASSTTYTTNLNTGSQYRYDNGEWLKAVDGDYPVGTWRIDLAG
jgi:hypothetical protein